MTKRTTVTVCYKQRQIKRHESMKPVIKYLNMSAVKLKKSFIKIFGFETTHTAYLDSSRL
jgi:hypothetical protein